jgi:hypothetical protein
MACSRLSRVAMIAKLTLAGMLKILHMFRTVADGGVPVLIVTALVDNMVYEREIRR